MDKLEILRYGGVAVLVVLLVIFELTDRSPVGRKKGSKGGYEYYTPDGSCVLIRHVLGSRFKVYIYGVCPIATCRDRYGEFFKVNARSAHEAELKVDQAYGC